MTKTEFGQRFDAIQNSPEMEIYKNLLALKASFRVLANKYYQIIQYFYLWLTDRQHNIH
ncbi:MAG: hypothetical protein F6K61_15380 [Sphaerospermopsis sp. SIO1G1]|nr:hypothetical protein [Sphaerospermopsis sp. SIO1G1]